VLKYPFKKCFEIQCHAKAVERLKLTQDNSTLFTAGLDGTIACFSVVDQDRRKIETPLSQVVISPENLLLKTDLDKKKAKIDSLKASIA
jgi:hypothetical protein